MTKSDILHRSLQALQDCHQDAQQCGQPVVDILSGILSSLQSTTRLENTAQRCLMLKEQANEAISTYPYSEIPEHWRRLYMDATLLHVISRLVNGALEMSSADLLELVRLLDVANIITAYFDNGRHDVLFDLLRLVQTELGQGDPEREDRPTKRQRRHGKSSEHSVESSPTSSLLLPGIAIVKTFTIEKAPDMSELSDHQEPFIIKGAVSDWPAIASSGSAWSSSEYLLKIAGKGRIVPVEIGSSYTAEGWTQKMMDFSEFLAKINWEDKDEELEPLADQNKGEEEEEGLLYLAQHDLFQQFPQLSADILIPDYVLADPGPPSYFPDYQPPNVLAGYTKNAWMGPKGTYSPAHTDPYYNCYAQVVGKKHIWVAPPSSSYIMEGHLPNQEQFEGFSSENGEDGDERNAAAQQYMDNTAQIDVFEASAKADNESNRTTQIRRFREEVLPFARQAILEEGDLLFMPPKWWHSLKALEKSFSVSMWF